MSKMWMYSFVFSVWCFQGSMPIGVQVSNLVKNLHAGHTTDIRPQPNIKDGPTNVNMTIKITQILDIDEKNEILSILVWVNMYWEDMTFTWDPGAYGNVRKLIFPASDIWIPDVILYNTDDIDMGFHLGLPRDDEDQHFFATATANGSIALGFPQVFKSACKLNIGEYPFDTQHCKMDFGSWSHDSSELQIHMEDNEIKKETQYFLSNKAWQQTGSKCVEAKQPCSYDFSRECSVVSCSLDLKRTAWFEIISYTLPTIVIAVCSLMVFMVPPEAGKRMEVGITLILCLAVYLSLVNKKMPSTSEAFPLVTQFYGCIIVQITIAMVCSCFCLHIYDPEGLRLLHFPNYLRTLGFGVLARVICYKTDGGKTSRVHPTSKVDRMDIARRRKSEFKSNGEVFFVKSAQNKQNDFSLKMENINEKDENNTNNNQNKAAKNKSKEELFNKESNNVVDNGSESSAMKNVKKTKISKEDKSDKNPRRKQLEGQTARKDSTHESRKEKSISDRKTSKESQSNSVENRKETQVPLKEIHRSKGVSGKENERERRKSEKVQDTKRNKDSVSHREREKNNKGEIRKSEGKTDAGESGSKEKTERKKTKDATKKSDNGEHVRESGTKIEKSEKNRRVEDIKKSDDREGIRERGNREGTKESGKKDDTRKRGNREGTKKSVEKEDKNESKSSKDTKEGNKEYIKEKGTKEDNKEINNKQNAKDNSDKPDGKDTSNKEHKNSTAEEDSKRAKVARRESQKETSKERKKSVDVPQQNINKGETSKDDEGSKKEKKVKVTDSHQNGAKETNNENGGGRRVSRHDSVGESEEITDKSGSKNRVSKEGTENEEQSSKQENDKENDHEKGRETPENTTQPLIISKEIVEQLQLEEEVPEARSEPMLIEENEAETVRVEKRCDSGFGDADGKGCLSNRSSTLSSASVSVPNGSESSHTDEMEEIGQVLEEQDDCEEILKIDRAVTIPLVSRTAGNFKIRVSGMARVTSTLVKANHGFIPKSMTTRPYTDSVLRRWPARYHSDKRLGSDMQVKKMLFAEIESQSDIEEETTKRNYIEESSNLVEDGEKQNDDTEKETVTKNDLKPHQAAQKPGSSDALVVRRKLSSHNSEVEIDLPIEEAHVDAPNEVTIQERIITVQEKDSDEQESSKENKEHVIDPKDLFARRNWGVVKAKIRNRFTVQELFGQILSPKETNPIIAIANVVTRDQRKFVMRTEWMTSAMIFNRFFIILLSLAVFISVLAIFFQSSRLRGV